MGNPAGVTAKKSEKRRKKHEQRLEIGRYAPTPETTKKPKAAKKAESAK